MRPPNGTCRSRTDGGGPLRTGKKGPGPGHHDAADSDSDSCGNESRPISCSSRARVVALGKAPAGARHRTRAAVTRRDASRSWGASGLGRPLRYTLRLGAEVERARPNAHQPRRATRWHEGASKTKRPRGPRAAEAPGRGRALNLNPTDSDVRVCTSASHRAPSPSRLVSLRCPGRRRLRPGASSSRPDKGDSDLLRARSSPCEPAPASMTTMQGTRTSSNLLVP